MKPLRVGHASLRAAYDAQFAALEQLPLLPAIFDLAAGLRATSSLRTPDALHAARSITAAPALDERPSRAKQPWHDGTTHVSLTPSAFFGRPPAARAHEESDGRAALVIFSIETARHDSLFAMGKTRVTERSRTGLRRCSLGVLVLSLWACDAAAPIAVDAGRDTGPGCGADVEPAGLAWEDCHGSFRCATVEVPLDHSAPGGATIGIRILRVPAECPAMRRGILTFNPGGPGASGIAAGITALPLVRALAPEIRREVDVIAFDPRGIGESAPIECGDGARWDAIRLIPLEPSSAAEWSALDAEIADFASDCAAMSPPGLLEHVSTEDVARDMDLVRAALGFDRLDYLGVSYGSVLGATYATLFPDRIRAFVLDSSLHLGEDVFDTYARIGLAYEAELSRFFEACGAAAVCAFHGGAGIDAVAAAYDAVEADLAAGGATVGGRRVGTIDLAAASSNTLRAGDTDALAALLAAAEAGDATMLLEQADAFFGRVGPGDYGDTIDALFAVVQADNACPPGLDLAGVQAEWASIQEVAPRVGALHALSGIACLHWSTARGGPPFAVSAPSAPRLLVLGGVHDPAAPVVLGQELRELLGNESYFITYEGAGHGYAGLSACARNAELAFLVDPATPPAVTVCPAE